MHEKWLSILVLIMRCRIASSCGSNLLKDRSKSSSVGKDVMLGGWEQEGERSKYCRKVKKE